MVAEEHLAHSGLRGPLPLSVLLEELTAGGRNAAPPRLGWAPHAPWWRPGAWQDPSLAQEEANPQASARKKPKMENQSVGEGKGH